jgi:hypothetical protein
VYAFINTYFTPIGPRPTSIYGRQSWPQKITTICQVEDSPSPLRRGRISKRKRGGAGAGVMVGYCLHSHESSGPTSRSQMSQMTCPIQQRFTTAEALHCRELPCWSVVEGILTKEVEDAIAQQTRHIVGGKVNVQCMLGQGTASASYLTCFFLLLVG